jgi:putative FmdB family regulatory protein
MAGIAELDMPIYEFSCHKCELVFDKLYREIPKKIPKKAKCPECGKLADKEFCVGTFKVKGKPYRLSKSDVMNFYNGAIEDSKEGLKLENTKSPYRRYVPDFNTLTKNGTLRQLSDKELKETEHTTRKIGEKINEIKTRSKKK